MNLEHAKFNTYADLAKLPWFDFNGDGKLRVKPGEGVPPILDAHTHLGWSYFFGGVVDYQRLAPEVGQFYNYVDMPVEMDKDEHPTKAESDKVTWDIVFMLFRCPPIARTQTAANLLVDMKLFGVVGAVVLPIELPIRSRHAYQCVVNCKPHDSLLCFAGVHPWTRFKKLRLDWQVENGAWGLKYHPEFQFNPPDTKGALDLFGMCAERGLPVLGHSGSTGAEPQWMQNMSMPDRYRAALKAHPKLKMILAHAGIRYYEQALAVAGDFPNQVWLETSGQGAPVLKRLLAEFDPSRILYGSDWTFFPMGVPIARSMIALEGFSDEVREGYFFRNLARLLDLDEDAAARGAIVRKRAG